jgi:DNA polymerase I-like protein with 3'-5' exonuclease and polymerase domains
MVGHDASGLELRMLAHYLNDEEFTKQILEGDIHTFNMEKAGLPNRDAAKTFIYALIYGAGDAKIGDIVGGTSEDGKAIKERYFNEFPAIKKFIAAVKRAAGKGWLKGLDGRKVYIRRDSSGRLQRSKAPNTLLQHAGAVVMKKSCQILWELVEERGIKAYKVLDMHDEGQSEVLDDPKNLELYCEAAVESIIKAGEHFNMNIPLDAEAKVGISWAETH